MSTDTKKYLMIINISCIDEQNNEHKTNMSTYIIETNDTYTKEEIQKMITDTHNELIENGIPDNKNKRMIYYETLGYTANTLMTGFECNHENITVYNTNDYKGHIDGIIMISIDLKQNYSNL